MTYPYSNEELLNMFRESGEPNFMKFLNKLEDEIPPCESCERNGEKNCGNWYCPTRKDIDIEQKEE